jgi:DNA-directed RNA polymerase specialized sigma24 family protein
MCEESFAPWLKRLEQGDESAVRELWDNFFPELCRKAQKLLAGHRIPSADEQDVALSALKSFCVRAKGARFPLLRDREGLWKLLVTMTTRKAIDVIRREHAEIRGGGNVRGESVFLPAGDSSSPPGMERVSDNQLTPAVGVLAAEQCEKLLDRLEDDSLRAVALFKLAGYTNEEIAGEMSCALRTVKRRLAYIRERWAEYSD